MFSCTLIGNYIFFHRIIIPIFFTECIDQMVLSMRAKDEISPTLRNIVDRFDENNQRPLNTFFSAHNSEEQVNSVYNEAELDGDAFENCNTWTFDHDDQSVIDEDSYAADPFFPVHNEVFDFLPLRKGALSVMYFVL